MPEVDEGGAHCAGKVGFNMGEQRRIGSPWKASEERLSALLISLLIAGRIPASSLVI